MTDDEIERHLATLPTCTVATLFHAYRQELKKRHAWTNPLIPTSAIKGQNAAIRLCWAAGIAKQSLLLVGPPGCGKTMLRTIAGQNSPDIVIGELRTGEESSHTWDGATEMADVNLDTLMFAAEENTHDGLAWARTQWRPVTTWDSLAVNLVTNKPLSLAAKRRIEGWASALASLDGNNRVEVSNVREATSIVTFAIEVSRQ